MKAITPALFFMLAIVTILMTITGTAALAWKLGKALINSRQASASIVSAAILAPIFAEF
jgi:hypothetical protein